MKRHYLLPIVLFLSGPALAHPGHIASESGHSHWLALAALCGALSVGAIGYVRHVAERRRRQRLAHD